MRVVLIFLALVASVFASEITDAINDLGAGKFTQREAGVRRLVQLAEVDHDGVLRECVRAYRQTSDPEVKTRLRGVMRGVVDTHLYRAPRGFLGIQMGNVGQGAGLNVQGGVFVRQGGALVLQGGNVNLGGIQIEGDGKLIVNNLTITTNSGIWVTGLVPDSAAVRAGLQVNDFIIAVNDLELRGTNFSKYIQSQHPGTAVKLRILRGGQTNQSEVVLGELPQDARDKILTEEGGREFFRSWLRDQVSSGATNTVPPAKK